MVLFSQLVCLLAIVILGLYIYKKFPMKFQLKDMSIASLLIVVALLLSYMSIMIPMFGFPSLKFSFAQIPLMCLGIVLGPGYAFLSGIIYDLLGLLINPTSFPFLGFTLNNILVAVIPALWYKQKQSRKTTSWLALGITIIATLVFIIYIWTYTDTAEFVEKYMEITTQMKLMISGIFILFVSVVIGIMGFWIKKKDEQFIDWVFCLIVIEMFVHLLLSPLWLEVMYSIPYMVNLFMRVIKTAIVIPMFSILGMPLVRLARKLYK